jgi:hypothetical protein
VIEDNSIIDNAVVTQKELFRPSDLDVKEIQRIREKAHAMGNSHDGWNWLHYSNNLIGISFDYPEYLHIVSEDVSCPINQSSDEGVALMRDDIRFDTSIEALDLPVVPRRLTFSFQKMSQDILSQAFSTPQHKRLLNQKNVHLLGLETTTDAYFPDLNLLEGFVMYQDNKGYGYAFDVLLSKSEMPRFLKSINISDMATSAENLLKTCSK